MVSFYKIVLLVVLSLLGIKISDGGEYMIEGLVKGEREISISNGNQVKSQKINLNSNLSGIDFIVNE